MVKIVIIEKGTDGKVVTEYISYSIPKVGEKMFIDPEKEYDGWYLVLDIEHCISQNELLKINVLVKKVNVGEYNW